MLPAYTKFPMRWNHEALPMLWKRHHAGRRQSPWALSQKTFLFGQGSCHGLFVEGTEPYGNADYTAMEDFCQLTNKLTEQKYRGSMEQVGKALRGFSSTPGLDAIRFFELALFCYLTGNSDMHLKNFSLLYERNGSCQLAPAYDLLPSQIILLISFSYKFHV